MEEEKKINCNNVDKEDCFARIDCSHCNALNEKDCKNCSFYKPRNKIKNNPFYAFSYRDSERHAEHMRRYRVNPDDVIY